MIRTLPVLLALACTGSEEAPAPKPVPPPTPEAPPSAVSAPLDGYAYLPGPSGGAEGARFSRFANSQRVYVGVDDANLRDAEGNVVDRLRLGTPLTIAASVSEPTVAIDRLNAWYTVTTTGDGVEGRLFGGLLTPFGGTFYSEATGEERGWAVSFAPNGKPRLRIDAAPGSDEAITLDLTVTERFTGGRMEAELVGWGDFELRFQVMLCRVDGGEAPGCETVTVRHDPEANTLVQLTPPDASQYAAPWQDPVCEAGSTLPLTPRAAPGEPIRTMEMPGYMRGPETEARCYDVGTVPDGPHAGKTVTSCVQGDPGKVGPYGSLLARYVRDADGWTYLPCASTTHEGATLQALLVRDRIRVTIDTSISAIAGLDPHQPVTVGDQTLTYSHRSPHFNPDRLTPAFSSPLGPAFTADGAVLIPQPDGTALSYTWEPTLTWAGTPPSDKGYLSQTTTCDGDVDEPMTLEPGVSAADLETVATLTDGTVVGRLRSADHPVSQRLLSWYAGLGEAESYQRPEDLELGLSPEALLSGNPWLFIPTPWGGYLRLTREDLKIPLWCEPILYTYADPPAPITITPGETVRFHRTRPHGPDGWSGIAQPDGSTIVGGQRWPELFWEGESVWFDRPEDGVVVAEEDLAAYLTLALSAQGLVGRELDGFLDAWLPVISDQGPVWIGFHPQETVEALAPLRIEPPPDTLIRILMDAAPVDAAPDWDGSVPDFPAPPERQGVVVVEWGGMKRQ